MQISAALIRAAGHPFESATLELDEPRDDEVLVQITGVGLCHTDLAAQQGAMPVTLPAVFGHEGAGIVLRTGRAVRKVQAGDRVALSFLSCGHCPNCDDQAPAYCHQMASLNFIGRRADGSQTLREGQQPVSGSFFGQSSFATHALAHERNLVKVPEGVPLEIAGTLGCGIQTGAGAVLRSMDCKPGKTLLVLGGGAVGLSAVMAARLRGLAQIIVVEPHQARRDLALSLGATAVIDPRTQDTVAEIRRLAPWGVPYAFDTTGLPAVIAVVPQVLAPQGVFGFVGIPPREHLGMPLPMTMLEVMSKGYTLRGIIEGDSDVDLFMSELMTHYLAGRFPFDRLVKTFPLSAINEAVQAQHRGECVKAVLLP